MKRSGWLVATMIALWTVGGALAQTTALSQVSHSLLGSSSNQCDVVEGKELYIALNNLFKASSMFEGIEGKSLLVRRVELFMNEADICSTSLLKNLSRAEERKLFNLLKVNKTYSDCKSLREMVDKDIQSALDIMKKSLVARETNETAEQFKSWCRFGATREAKEGYAKAYFLAQLLESGIRQSPMEEALQSGFRRARLEVENYINKSLLGNERKNRSALTDLRASRAQRSLHYLRKSLKRSYQDSWAD